jgi:hypothetical protein
MNCCHADFALVEGSDCGFTAGMPTCTFGARTLRKAGPQAQEQGSRRVALFTDKHVAANETFATVRSPLAAANTDAFTFDEVSIEPPDASFQASAGFARDADVDGYVSVGGGSVMDTRKAANLYPFGIRAQKGLVRSGLSRRQVAGPARHGRRAQQSGGRAFHDAEASAAAAALRNPPRCGHARRRTR